MAEGVKLKNVSFAQHCPPTAFHNCTEQLIRCVRKKRASFVAMDFIKNRDAESKQLPASAINLRKIRSDPLREQYQRFLLPSA